MGSKAVSKGFALVCFPLLEQSLRLGPLTKKGDFLSAQIRWYLGSGEGLLGYHIMEGTLAGVHVRRLTARGEVVRR